MTSIFILYLAHQIALAIGLASSLIVDIFIIIVEKTKHIRGIEKKVIDRVLSYSFISSLIIFLIQMSYIFFIVLTDTSQEYSSFIYIFSTLTTLISATLLFTVATQKYYQIKILYRYQEKHEHLSNSFIEHHKELRYTALLSVILWIALYICYVMI
jgi:hypothetical protein